MNTEKVKFVSLSAFVSVVLASSIAFTGVIASETKDTMNTLENELRELRKDIQEAKKSREEDYEKRFKELADRIQAIENEPDWAPLDDWEEIEDPEPEETEEVVLDNGWEYDISEDLPTCDTNTFRCMDYRTLTNHASDQWKLQEECYTDKTTGIRYYIHEGSKYYCAALGSAYTETIGDAFSITLNNGYSFNVVNGDFKVPLGTPNFYGHPDRNYDGEYCINIVEFIFDKNVAPKSVINAGTMSVLDNFGGLYGNGGNIVSIERVGKVWNV